MADDAGELRRKVALSCRILAMKGLVRETTGHVSARIPGTAEMFIRGRANGVEYVAPGGASYFQRARTVILASYTFENIRLMLLSGDERHPRGLGNNSGQVT